MKKVILRLIAAILLLIIGLIIFIFANADKDFEAPLGNLKASKDSAVIARGKYLAYGPAHCASCHMPKDKVIDNDKGIEMPLSGGFEIVIPPGTFRAPNLTPDNETGIGKLSDAQLERAMRYSVNHRNKLMFPFMPFQEMSNEDVIALISFLRSQPAVKHEVKNTEHSFLGKALIALGAVNPEGPKNNPPNDIAIDSTAKYGEYLAHKVANCVGCHTNRNLETGEFIGPILAGGLALPPDEFSQGYTYVSPNLTPDSETGVMASWNESAFINRMRAGRVHNSAMPWGSFARMNDIELKALYSYLHSLAPVKNKIEKTVYKPGEKVIAQK
jgi:mono/diheme cytochrome c family protein